MKAVKVAACFVLLVTMAAIYIGIAEANSFESEEWSKVVHDKYEVKVIKDQHKLRVLWRNAGYPNWGTTENYLYDRENNTVTHFSESSPNTAEDDYRSYAIEKYGYNVLVSRMAMALADIGNRGLADRLVAGELYNDDPERETWFGSGYAWRVDCLMDSHQVRTRSSGESYIYDRDLDVITRFAGDGDSTHSRGGRFFDSFASSMKTELRMSGRLDLGKKLERGVLYNDDATRREWNAVVDGEEIKAMRDSHQIKVTTSKKIYIYDRNHDIVIQCEVVDNQAGYSENYQFAKDQTGFNYIIRDMAGYLRELGRDILAERLENGKLYNGIVINP